MDLDDVSAIAARESGLAVAITMRPDGTPRASVVNAGVLPHPDTGEQVVGFVSRGDARKLDDLRRDPRATIVFRSDWDWIAVEGDATVIGPDDPDVLAVVRSVYAAAVGGDPAQWAELDSTLSTERHTAVLIRPSRMYPTTER